MDNRRFLLSFVLSVFFFSGPISAIYGSGSDVVQLTPSSFDSKVLQRSGVVLVEFYAPWCGHCKQLAPEWEQAATALKGIVTVAAVDCDQHQAIAQQYEIKGFPTIKAFGIKQSPIDYNGGRDAASIANWALSQVKQVVKARLGGKSTGGGGGEKSASVVLTDSSFGSEVLQSSDVWLIEFFAPWCGHCKKLAPEWKRAATSLKDTQGVKLGQVDCTVETGLAQKYGIKGFPTILIFGPDKSDEPKPYEGARTSGAIESFAREIAEANVPAPEVVELTGKAVFDNCAEVTLCLIAFLPDILDTGAAGRNKYIETLNQVAEKFKRKPYRYVWVEAGKQPELEKALQVGGYGYPAMVSLNVNLKRMVPFKGGFEKDMIGDFLKLIERSLKGVIAVADLPEVKETEPWDGKDGQLLEEDEFSLDDLMGDDSTKEEL